MQKNYVSSNNLGTDAYTYSFDPQMKSAKVIYGTFKSMKDAQEAMNNLPASVIANKPYIDKISKHQNYILNTIINLEYCWDNKGKYWKIMILI